MGRNASVVGVGWNGDPGGSTLCGVCSALGFTTPGKYAAASDTAEGEAEGLALDGL